MLEIYQYHVKIIEIIVTGIELLIGYKLDKT